MEDKPAGSGLMEQIESSNVQTFGIPSELIEEYYSAFDTSAISTKKYMVTLADHLAERSPSTGYDHYVYYFKGAKRTTPNTVFEIITEGGKSLSEVKALLKGTKGIVAISDGGTTEKRKTDEPEKEPRTKEEILADIILKVEEMI